MVDRRRRPTRAEAVDADLVQYLVIAVPEVGSLAAAGPALADLVKAEAIRVLDLLVVVRKISGGVTVLEFEDVEGLEELTEIEGDLGGLLSDHDVELISLALRPGGVGLVIVTEDRWAQPLSSAVHQAGGRIVAGDRIPAARAIAALTDIQDDDAGEDL